MKVLQIPKGGGRYRTVYDPDPEHKRRLRALVPQLNLIAEELDVHGVQHGFREGRSPVTNAKAHIGFQYSLSMDLDSFFDTVTYEKVFKAIPVDGLKDTRNANALRAECFVHCVAVQGFPTSPALANIAATPMDNEIMSFKQSKGRLQSPPFSYTRYADDLTISANDLTTILFFQNRIPLIAEKHGFKVNDAKTKVQCAKAGRRIITGIAVGEKDITITRKLRRRIRAGNHQAEHGMQRRLIRRILFRSGRLRKRRPLRYLFFCQLRGLKEWSRLRGPKNPASLPVWPAVKVAVKIVTAVLGQSTGARLSRYFARKLAI